jgi:hypothetical protein
MREAEESETLPIVAHDVRVVERETRSTAPLARVASSSAVQAAAVAAGGFVAGAAVLSLVHRRGRAGAALPKGRRRALGTGSTPAPVAETLQVVSTRTFLVDVHRLAAPGADG